MKYLSLLLVMLSTSLFAQYNLTEIDINPLYGDSNPNSFVELNGYIYFMAEHVDYGEELWKSDGTQDGTSLVKDININGNSTPKRLTVLNDKIFFTADTDEYGRELWVTDGTEEGTVMVKDILPGLGDGVHSSREPFKIFNNKIILVGHVIGAGNSFLFLSDGTEEGTNAISTAVALEFGFYSEYNLVVLGDQILFPGGNKIGPYEGTELWRTDGTADSTIMMMEIFPGYESSWPGELTVFNDEVYFVAEDGVNGKELWKTNGYDDPVLVKDIYEGGYGCFSSHARFQVFNNKLFFSARTDGVNREIWSSDGTEEGTQLFIDINTNDNQSGIDETDLAQQLFYVIGDKMYFGASDIYDWSSSPGNQEPWVTDGTLEGTMQLADVNPDGSSMVDYDNFFAYDGHVFFTSHDPSEYPLSKLYYYDESTNSATLVEPQNTTMSIVKSDVVFLPFVFGADLFISAQFDIDDENHGVELWKISEGTVDVEVLTDSKNLINIYPNPTSDLLFIETDDHVEFVKIHSLTGVMLESHKSINQLNISHYNKGIYLVEVETNMSKQFIKLIVK